MQDTVNMAAESEFDEEEEPLFSDPEDFVEDIDDEGEEAAMKSAFRYARGLNMRQSPCTIDELKLLK